MEFLTNILKHGAGAFGAPGEIITCAGAAVPDGWLACEGQLLASADYPVLFAAIGDVYGGDGLANFAVPNYRSAGMGMRRIICVDLQASASVLQVTVPAAIHGPVPGSYNAGDVLSFSMQLLEDIAITGGPVSLAIDIGGVGHTMAFTAGTAREWVFADYTVQAGDNGAVTAAINLNGATLSSGGVSAVLSLESVVTGVIVDIIAPTLAITSNVSAVKIGEAATITFTFSEDPGASFAWDGSTGDIVVTGGTLSAISGIGLTRTATFSPTINYTGSASITVAAGGYTDTAGNNGGAGTTPSLSIDTLAPTLVITSNVSAVKVGETATITFTFSEDPGTSFVWDGSTGDIVVTGGTLGAISGIGLTRTAIFTPTANLASGSANITVAAGTYTDTAGNNGGAGTTPSLSIDTLAPTAPTINAQTTASTTPTITGTATVGAGESLTVFVNSITYSLGADLSLAGTAWTLKVPVSHALSAGTYNVTATVTDAAGNATSDSTSGELVITA